MNKRREKESSSKIWIIGILGVVIALATIFIIGLLGSSQQKTKLKDAVKNNDLATLMSMSLDSQGNPIKKDVFDVYKEDIKKAVHNELDGNGGINKSIIVDYDGVLIKKPKIIVNQFTMEITDLAPELIVVVNDKEIPHGNDSKVKVTAIPGKNIVRFIMNSDFYKDTGSTAEVNFKDGLTQAQVNSGYGFQNFTINVNKDSMLTINGREVRELKSGKNSILLPTNLDLIVAATDRVNVNLKSNEVKISKELVNIDLKLNSTTENRTRTTTSTNADTEESEEE